MTENIWNLFDKENLDENQSNFFELVESFKQKIDKDGLFRLKHIPFEELNVGHLRNLSLHQIFYDPNLEGYSDDIIQRTAIAELIQEQSTCKPIQVFLSLKRHIRSVGIEGIGFHDFKEIYKGVIVYKYYNILKFWSIVFFPDLRQKIDELITVKYNTYESALKFINSNFRGFSDEDEFRFVIKGYMEEKSKELSEFFRKSELFNKNQLTRFQKEPDGKKFFFAREILDAVKLSMKKFDHQRIFKLAMMNIEAPVNKKKYFLYNLLSEWLNQDYPSNEKIIEILETDQVGVSNRDIAVYKRNAVRKFFG